MEFWIGLSVGMHLGKVLADYLEQIAEAYGLVDKATAEKTIKKIDRRSEMGTIVTQLIEE
jgi:hypothetical protein